MALNRSIAHVQACRILARRMSMKIPHWSPGFQPLPLMVALLMLASGCEEQTPPPALPPPPSTGSVLPTNGTGTTLPAPVRPDSKLPPVSWLELTQPPEIEAVVFTPEELSSHRLIVVAVPVDGFPTFDQGDRQYRQALFQDWSLLPYAPQVTTTEYGPERVVCRAAIPGTQGAFSLATQKDPTTQKLYLRSAAVAGNADAIHLLFLVPRAATPFTVRYRTEDRYVCAREASAVLINRLFLPKRPPSRWQESRIDLSEQPLVFTHFGSCVEIRRETYLSAKNEQGEPTTLKPSEGRVFLAFHFTPRADAFDFQQSDWNLTLADSTTLQPYGVSANGGKGYLLNIATASGCSGGATTLPVLLFQVPQSGTPIRMQHRTQVVPLPR